MMGKSKELDNILNECLERVLLSGQSVEECLRSYPEYAEELRPLLDTVVPARQVSAIEPRPEFKAGARYQFQRALREKTARQSRGLFNWRPAWSAVVASIVTFILVSGVTVGAAGNSMPDQPLYPVKLATEQVQLAVTQSPLEKAELYAELADKRVAEIVYLADEGKPEVIEAVTRRLDTNLTKIAVLTQAPTALEGGRGGAPTVPEAVPPQATEEQPGLMLAPEPTQDEPAPTEPAPGKPALKERAPAKVAPEKPALRAEPPTEKPDKATPTERLRQIEDRAELRAVIARYAKNHPDKLRQALKNAPPAVRRALLRAIAISKTRYKQANEALEKRQDGTEQAPPTPKTAPERSLNPSTPKQTFSQTSPTPLETYRARLRNTNPQLLRILLIEDEAKRSAALSLYARNNPEKLRQALNNAPSSVVRIIRQAMASQDSRRTDSPANTGSPEPSISPPPTNSSR